MKPPPRLVRRLVLDPLWIPLAVLLAVILVLVALVGLLAAPLDGRLRAPRLALSAALYCLVDAWLVGCCAAMWLRSPLPAMRGQRWTDAHQKLLSRALGLLVSAAWPLLGFRVELEELPERVSLAGHPLLVLARHGGPGDSFAIAGLLLSVYRRRPVIVLKEVLQWDPGLDVILGRLPALFLPSGGSGRDLAGQVADLARTLGGTDAMLIFPEGSNWTPRRHLHALARLRARGRREAAATAAANRHVLPPQPAGALACLAARPDLEVVVVAHTGLDDLVSIADVWHALPVRDQPMLMRWWHHAAADLPADADLRQQWLDVQWAIVDSWIDARKAAASTAKKDTAYGRHAATDAAAGSRD